MKNKLALLNIILPILMLVILLFSELSENTVIIITLTLFIGWVIPYFICIISGIILYRDTHQRLGFIINNLNLLLLLILITFCIRIYDRNILIFIIEYSILTILSFIDITRFLKYIKTHPSKSKIEKKEIKEKKKKNNGAIV